MQNGYSILTRRLKGIDVNVWLTLLTVTVISLFMLIFRKTGDVPCQHFDVVAMDVFGSQKDSLFVNEDITFVAKVSGNIAWDFGDGSTKEGARVKHSFLTDGKQSVTATLNGKCDTTIILNINKVVTSVDVSLTNPIQGPSTVTIGKPKTFFYDGKNKETAIMWYIENAPGTETFYTERAKFNFNTAGPQTIVLKINNDPKKVFKKQVTVLPAPVRYDVPPPPVVINTRSSGGGKKVDTPTTPSHAKALNESSAPKDNLKSADFLSDEQFENFFNSVVKGQSNGQDIYKYLCNNTATTVTENGKSSTVEQVLHDLYKKRIKNIKVQNTRDAKNCVSVLNVTYVKKGILGF